MNQRQRNQWRQHQAALRGKFARKIGLELRHNPFKGRTGFGRQLWEAWEDGWKEQDREMRLARLLG
jgi:hypothetical protein